MIEVQWTAQLERANLLDVFFWEILLELSNRKLAVVMLACREFESLEIALACHMEFGSPDVPFYVLQNCFGGYDCERTMAVTARYAKLYPNRVKLITDCGSGAPWATLNALFLSPEFDAFDYICKVDDDAFPITPNWLHRLTDCWREAEKLHGDKLAFVAPLLNNNCWGFKRVIEIMGLEEEYFHRIAREHRVGAGNEESPYRVIPASEIDTGTCGTIWSNPHIARWLHEKSTLQPEAFAKACEGRSWEEMPGNERFSIGAILFRKPLWSAMFNGGDDDEGMLDNYCRQNHLKKICHIGIPFVHLAYHSQRAELSYMIEACRSVYQENLGVPYPIAMKKDRTRELEARITWMENELKKLKPRPLPKHLLEPPPRSLRKRIKSRLRQWGLIPPRKSPVRP